MTEMEQRVLLIQTEALQTIGDAMTRMALAVEHLAVEAARYNDRQSDVSRSLGGVDDADHDG